MLTILRPRVTSASVFCGLLATFCQLPFVLTLKANANAHLQVQWNKYGQNQAVVLKVVLE